jgi:hypothetical protein
MRVRRRDRVLATARTAVTIMNRSIFTSRRRRQDSPVSSAAISDFAVEDVDELCVGQARQGAPLLQLGAVP